MGRAIIMMCPAVMVAVSNATFAKLLIGDTTLTVPYALASDPSGAIVAYICHWGAAPETITSTIGQMLSGVLPTACLDEFDRPISITWDSPTEVEALAAMAAMTAKFIPYDDLDDYDPQAEVASMTELAGLVRWVDPNGV